MKEEVQLGIQDEIKCKMSWRRGLAAGTSLSLCYQLDSLNMDQSAQDLTLGQLLTRAINHSTKITSAPSPNDQSIQQLLQATLADLNLANKLINHLGILSPNETLEDINTSDLRCLLVDALSGQLCLLAKTKGGKERITYLNKASVSSLGELGV